MAQVPCCWKQWGTLCHPSCQDRDTAAQMHRMLPTATLVPSIWATVLLKVISGPAGWLPLAPFWDVKGCPAHGTPVSGGHLEDGEIPQAQPISPVSSVCSECSECYTARLTLLGAGASGGARALGWSWTWGPCARGCGDNVPPPPTRMGDPPAAAKPGECRDWPHWGRLGWGRDDTGLVVGCSCPDWEVEAVLEQLLSRLFRTTPRPLWVIL